MNNLARTIFVMFKYILPGCLLLSFICCKPYSQEKIAQEIAGKINADEYSVSVNTYKNTSGISLNEVVYKFTFPNSTNFEANNVIPLAAHLIYSMTESDFMNKRDSIKVVFAKSDFSESRSYSPEQLKAAFAAIDLMKYILSPKVDERKFIAATDTPITITDVKTFLGFSKSFRSMNEQDNDLKLVNYEFKKSLSDNTPAVIVRSDFSNKTEVAHIKFVISTNTNKIRYMAVNDEEP